MVPSQLKSIFNRTRPLVVGMIHVKPLPGTPLSRNSVEDLVSKAKEEAEIYKAANVDSVLIENMWDLPYIQSKEMGPEVVSVMTRVCSSVREIMPKSTACGVQVLAGGGEQALAVSLAADLQFVRVESFVFSHVADEGWMDACAGSLLRYRHRIGAQHVSIFTDIKKKHSAHAVTKDVTIGETAKAAEFFLSDGVILTGTSTGQEASSLELQEVKNMVDIPVLIGSGVTENNLENFITADGLIIGSHFKRGDKWSGELDQAKVCSFMEKIRTSNRK